MVKKKYCIAVDEEIMVKAKTHLIVGQKLSPVINDLLIKWVECMEKSKRGSN